DPTNTIPPDQPEGGLIWPAGAAVANVLLDTGEVLFTTLAFQFVATGVLPGVSGSVPAFPNGKLNFSRIRLPQGTALTVSANAVPTGSFVSTGGLIPAVVVLSCQDVILET